MDWLDLDKLIWMKLYTNYADPQSVAYLKNFERELMEQDLRNQRIADMKAQEVLDSQHSALLGGRPRVEALDIGARPFRLNTWRGFQG